MLFDLSYFEALARVRWGRDEEDVPLPQINLAMLVGREGGVPLCYRRVAGTMADVPGSDSFCQWGWGKPNKIQFWASGEDNSG